MDCEANSEVVAVTAGRVDATVGSSHVRQTLLFTCTVGGVTVCYLAIDVGSAKLAAGVVDEKGEVLVRDRISTPEDTRATASHHHTTATILPGMAHMLMLDPEWLTAAKALAAWVATVE